MTACPNCKATAKVAEVRRLPSKGITRRRFACFECAYRWTEVEQTGEAEVKRRASLTDDDILEILTCTASNSQMAAQLGIDRSTVSAIRLGKTHRGRLPELPRWGASSCDRCVQWHRGRCSLGHPDPLEEGLHFARWCASYQEAA